MIFLEGQFTQHWKESQQDDSCRLVSQAHNSMTKVVKYIKKNWWKMSPIHNAEYGCDPSKLLWWINNLVHAIFFLRVLPHFKLTCSLCQIRFWHKSVCLRIYCCSSYFNRQHWFLVGDRWDIRSTDQYGSYSTVSIITTIFLNTEHILKFVHCLDD